VVILGMSDTIIVLVEDKEKEEYEYNDEEKLRYGDNKVIVVPMGNGEKIRGYEADVVVCPEETDESIVNRVIRPMLAISEGEIVRY
jgi:hypothetical protein